VTDRVRGEVQKNTWEAFWRSSVEGLSVKEVAGQLGMTVGSVLYRTQPGDEQAPRTGRSF